VAVHVDPFAHVAWHGGLWQARLQVLIGPHSQSPSPQTASHDGLSPAQTAWHGGAEQMNEQDVPGSQMQVAAEQVPWTLLSQENAGAAEMARRGNPRRSWLKNEAKLMEASLPHAGLSTNAARGASLASPALREDQVRLSSRFVGSRGAGRRGIRVARFLRMARACPRVLVTIVALGSLGGVALVPTSARAGGLQAAVDIDYAGPIASDATSGVGFATRLGYQFNAPYLLATPELVFSYDAFSGGVSPKAYRGLAGARLALGDLFRSGAYFHMGVGVIHPDAPDNSHTDFSYDLGGFVELTVLPSLVVGAHAAYNRVTGGPDALQWGTVGGHLALIF
jgi:hypothetical protein